MSRFQLKLADRQCRMAELSQRCQDFITILTTSMYGARQSDTIGPGRGRHHVPEPAAEAARPAAVEPLLPPRDRARRGDRRRRSSAPSPASKPNEILMPYEQ